MILPENIGAGRGSGDENGEVGRDASSPASVGRISRDLTGFEEDFELLLDMAIREHLDDTEWRSVEESIKKVAFILEDLPLICQVDDCPYARKCDVLARMPDPAKREKLRGTLCRSEMIFMARQFVYLVRDLKIPPSAASDILNVIDLVRNLVLKRRIDWHIALEGMLEDVPAAVSPDGTIYTRRVPHPLIVVAETLQKQINVLYKQLMASRRDRLTLVKEMRKDVELLKRIFTILPPGTSQECGPAALPSESDVSGEGDGVGEGGEE